MEIDSSYGGKKTRLNIIKYDVSLPMMVLGVAALVCGYSIVEMIFK